MLQLKRVPRKTVWRTAITSRRTLRTVLILMVLGLLVLLPSFASAATATKSNGTDAALDNSSITRTVDFTTSDFSGTALISKVTLSIEIEKIDGNVPSNCFSTGWAGGSPYNGEIYAILSSPGGTDVLLIDGIGTVDGSSSSLTSTYSTTSTTYGGQVIIAFDDDAATQVGGPAPSAGTFRPEEALSAFEGQDPLGTWTLTVGDSAAGAPLCFYDFSLTVEAVQGPTVDDQTFNVPEDSPDGTSVGTIVATDPDPGDKLNYTVTGGTGQNVFDVDILTGEITVADETQLDVPSTFTLNVTVTDSAALSDTATITINVTDVNDPPVITEGVGPVAVTMDEDGNPTPFSLTLNATDEESDTLTWSISSQGSDGTASASSPGNSSTIDYTPDPDYNGSDSFVVEVSDGNGGTDTITVDVTIDPVNDDPDAVDDTFTVDEDSSDNALLVLQNDTYFPDEGETMNVTAVGPTDNGGTAINNILDITYTPAPNFSGTEVFTYTIGDGNGGSDTATVTVTVSAQNDPPVIAEGAAITVTMSEDSNPTPFSLTLNASDADVSDSLTWSIQSQADDGIASIGGSNPANSMSINYMPNTNYNGSDSFVVQVSDGKGGTDTITVNVTINAQNDPPNAVNDTFTVDENSNNNSLSVLANDTTPDNGETLEITTVGATDNGGTATNNTTNILYSPAASFVGTEVFTYTISDGNGLFDTATVTVTVQDVNEAPIITEGISTTVTMDEDGNPTAFSLTLNATDGDNDTLTWSIHDQANHGTASASGTGTSKSIGYTPSPNYNGTDVFIVRVSDGRGGTDDITVNVNITAQNDNPDAVDDNPSVDEQSSNNTLYPLLNDTIAPDSGETLTITAVGTPDQGGSVTINGTDLTYTPPSPFTGTEVFTYTISDGNGGSDTATISVSVDDVNFSPTITEGDAITVTMSEDGSPTPFSLTLNAKDPDANTLTWSIQSQAGHGTASASGTGTSKAIGYTPTANYNGTDSFIVQVSDGHGGLDSITVNVTINAVNDAPNAVNDTASTPPETAVIINVLNNDTDPENDTLTVTAVTQGSKGSVSHNATTVTYTPNANESGSDTFTYTISDGQGGSDTATVTVQLGNYEIFLPMVVNNFVSAPDLVVTNISASSNLIEVTIENQGTQATSSGFWVDFYINPSPIPTQPNQLWSELSSEGIAWGINTSLPAGGSLTLSYSTAVGAPNLYYSAEESNYGGSLPAGTPVYAQVDSAHLNSPTGGVLETHEILGEAYNNVSTQYTAAAATLAPVAPAASYSSAQPLDLPLR